MLFFLDPPPSLLCDTRQMHVDKSANEAETGPSVLCGVEGQRTDRPQLSTGGLYSHTGPVKWSQQLSLSLPATLCYVWVQ